MKLVRTTPRHSSPRAGIGAHSIAWIHPRAHVRASTGVNARAPRHAADPRRRRLLGLGAAAALAALIALLAAGATQATHPVRRPFSPRAASPNRDAPAWQPAVLTQAAAVRDQAAQWVAAQVSSAAILACDPAMCAALAHRGIPSGNLLVLRFAAPDPLGADVVVETAALRAQFGSRLAGVYAPLVMAGFGAGDARIEVRAVAPDGTAASRLALAADLRARRSAGRELLGNPHLGFSPSARAQLAAGQPDARLLITLAALAAGWPMQVLGFGDTGPAASAGLPMRAAQLTAPATATGALLAFLRAQRAPYRAARVSVIPVPGGRSLLTIEFAAPSPLDLLPSNYQNHFQPGQPSL